MENPAEVYASCPSGYKVFLSGQMTGHGESRGASMMPFFLMTIVFVTHVYKTIMYNIYIYIYVYIHDLTHVYTHNMQIHSYIYIYIAQSHHFESPTTDTNMSSTVPCVFLTECFDVNFDRNILRFLSLSEFCEVLCARTCSCYKFVLYCHTLVLLFLRLSAMLRVKAFFFSCKSL